MSYGLFMVEGIDVTLLRESGLFRAHAQCASRMRYDGRDKEITFRQDMSFMVLHFNTLCEVQMHQVTNQVVSEQVSHR